MSTAYFSWSYPLGEETIERGAASVVSALRTPAAQDDLVRDESRGDWYLATVEKMVRNHSSQALRFLDRSRAARFVDESGQAWSVATVATGEVRQAQLALEQLLQFARLDPARMLPYFSALGSTQDDVRDAIKSPREVDGDEGLGPHYLFAHLDELCGLLQRAADAGLAIAHVRYLYE